MRAALPLVLLALCVTIRPLSAQWHVGLEIGATRYRASARDTSQSHVASEGHPGDATAIGMRFSWTGQRIGLAVRAAYAKPGLAVTGEGVTLTDKTSGSLLEFTSLLTTKVGGIGPSGAVRAELGPSLHLWNLDDEIRARVGATVAAAYEWPVAGRFSGAVRVEGVLSKSWFDAGDVPPEFERRVTWRYGVGLGLRYRL
jgi:hypothetical protein